MTNNNDKYVISLYDYTGEALKPWAEAGYQCIASVSYTHLTLPTNREV